MATNLERVIAVARNSLSRASTISVDEQQMALTKTDFLNIKEKMNRLTKE